MDEAMFEALRRRVLADEVQRTLARARQLAAEAPTPVGPTLLDYVISEADTRISQIARSGLSTRPLTDFREFLGNLKDFLEPE